MITSINNLIMNKITIKKTGFYFSFWEESQANWIEKNILESNLPITWYLNYPIQFAEILTVREIVSLIEPHSDIISLVMMNDLAGLELEKIIEKSKDPSVKKSAADPDSICLVRIAEATPTTQGEEEFNFLSTYPVLIGLVESIDESEEEDPIPLSSIDFLSWCDLPFELDDYVEYIDPTTEEVLFEGVMNWTLGEILSTIISQSSISIQVSQSVSVDSIEPSDPVHIDSVFQWIEDLDRILLKK
jgi:hypothetical protein